MRLLRLPHALGVLVLSTALATTPSLAVSISPPRVFFTDLQSGPVTGGEQNLGVFVAIYGEGFGAVRAGSTVTFGGVEVARYVSWGEDVAPRELDRIVVQPGPAVGSGPILVTVGGEPSNPSTFTVRAGAIRFVALGGADGNPGTLAQPWATVAHAEDSIGAGDTIFVRHGVNETGEDGFGASLAIETGGSPGLPKAIVAYPGATATLGSTALEFGVRVPNTGVSPSDLVLAGLVLRGGTSALDIGGDGASRWRVVANDISCPQGNGQTGCFVASLASHLFLLGNYVHDISQQGPQPSKQYHAVYFTTDTNFVAVGWNQIHHNRTCRAIQFHSSPLCSPVCGPGDTTGFNQHHLDVFDNRIDGDVCDGINFATVDPSQGPVRAWNNVVVRTGAGPTPPDGDANYAGVYVAGSTNTGVAGTGNVEVFHNTLVDCGRALGVPDGNTDRGAFARGPGSPALFLRLRDNVVVAEGDEPFVAPSSATELIEGSHNLWAGADSAPAYLSDNLEADPGFLDPFAGDFRLAAGSAAIDTGVAAGAADDYQGVSRVVVTVDRGAFEHTSELFADSFESGGSARWSSTQS